MLSKIRENKIEYLTLFFILVIAAFLRFYKITETLGFFGDEGRDALIVKRIIVDHKFTLIGPVTSAGNMYLGPLYYYMMILPMIIFNLDPTGAAYMIAGIGIITVFLVYFLGKKVYSREIGLLSAFIYALSASVVNGSRSSWNPNPMPFFVTLLILSLYFVYAKHRYEWLILTGLSFACAIQMHYLALALMPLILFIWFLSLREIVSSRKSLSLFIFYSLVLLLIIILFFLPLIIFDFRHGFINIKAIYSFFSERNPGFSLLSSINNIEGRTQNLIGILFTKTWQRNLTPFYLIGIMIGSIMGLLKKKYRKITLIIISWLLIGILGLAAYRGDIYPHYLGFLFPAPFFLLSLFFKEISGFPLGKVLSFVLISIFIYLNIKLTPYKIPLAWNITKVRDLASVIARDVNESKYNIVWLSSVKDYRAMNYRYFLEVMGKKPLDLENYSQAKVLYVVVEGKPVNPIDYPIWEIQSFGKAKIDKIFLIKNSPTVYKLLKI